MMWQGARGCARRLGGSLLTEGWGARSERVGLFCENHQGRPAAALV
jgi:hypothetical protein